MDAYQDRFNGVERLYGQQAVAGFKAARVAVIGVGGVGSWTVEALARSGVGHLVLYDLDDVCVSNTNRQSHTTVETLGQFKVDVLAQRCRSINPDIQVDPVQSFITPDNLTEVGLEQMDYVVDAIDSVPVKVAMAAYLTRVGVPFVLTGGAGGQTDPTRIQRADLARAIQDPLISRVRQNLRRHHGFLRGGQRMGVPCIFSDEPLRYPQPDGTVCGEKRFEGGTRMNCAGGFGAAMVVTATFGMVAAGAALDCLAEKAEQSGTDRLQSSG